MSGSPGPVDVVFFQAGTISFEDFARRNEWHVYGELPRLLPDAKEYWLVLRNERQSVPDASIVPQLAQTVVDVTSAARRKNLNLVGVQLDIDSPTTSLKAYAHFLTEVRKALPSGTQLSITALLDWFRDGTDIAAVLNEVDEFVPQFYDLGDPKLSQEGAIAATVDAERWAPIFNRFGRRYRIGIATFGRARALPATEGARSPYWGLSYFADLKPIEVSFNSKFRLQYQSAETGEAILTYRAVTPTNIGRHNFGVGEGIEFILPTAEVVRSAVRSAKKMGGYAAGVVFFRWPATTESLALQPGDVLQAAQLKLQVPAHPQIQTSDGSCAAVTCVDLFLNGAPPLSPRTTRYSVHISRELEYFLPAEHVSVRLAGPRDLEVVVPPYCACGSLALGRAVFREPVQFAVTEVQ